MAGLTPAHLLIILVIALIVIGPGKLPEVGAAIGKSFREFQKATSTTLEPAPAQPVAPAQQPFAGQVGMVASQPPVQPYYQGQPEAAALSQVPIVGYQPIPGASAPVSSANVAPPTGPSVG